MNYNEDDRAQRLCDIFETETKGQVNISYINTTEHIVAWHRHFKQTDYWVCLKGSMKVGLGYTVPAGNSNEVNVKFEYLSDKNFRVLEIPPGVWHGYKALEPGTILMYYVTEKYDPEDEIRKKVGDFGEEWGIVNK
jgi:dTDP-4-dehydrorhamnose 3,5-epimerase